MKVIPRNIEVVVVKLSNKMVCLVLEAKCKNPKTVLIKDNKDIMDVVQVGGLPLKEQ